jgi:D-cysteine desulfhydrase
MPERPILFSRYPALRGKIPFTSLGDYPSRVEHLKNLSKEIGTELWIKRDDCASCVYGGNKCRMMEWIIPDAVEKRRQSLVTWGALGSNQVLSSAIYGLRAGFSDITAVHNEQPIHPYVKRNFLISTSLGVKQIFASNPLYFLIKLWGRYLYKLITGKKPYLIPLVGSSPLAVVSYLDAALELKQQVESGQCPRPDYIFITVGTGGTAAGLMLGAMAFGGIGEVIGVRVLERIFVNETIMAWEINRTVRFLKKMGIDLKIKRIKARDIRLIHSYIGKGYAEITTEGEEAIRLARDHEDIELDITYTGKTMAAMLDFMKEKRGKSFLFWHTLNTVDLSTYTNNLPDIAKLKGCFQSFFNK